MSLYDEVKAADLCSVEFTIGDDKILSYMFNINIIAANLFIEEQCITMINLGIFAKLFDHYGELSSIINDAQCKNCKSIIYTITKDYEKRFFLCDMLEIPCLHDDNKLYCDRCHSVFCCPECFENHECHCDNQNEDKTMKLNNSYELNEDDNNFLLNLFGKE